MRTLPLDHEKPEPRRERLNQMREDVVAALKVLNTRDGLTIPDELLKERANAVITVLAGSYDLRVFGDTRDEP
jgi:hypothetical protein